MTTNQMLFLICGGVLLLAFIFWLFRKAKEHDDAVKYERENVIRTKFIEQNMNQTVVSSKTKGNSIGRAVVGGAVAGPVGAVIGAGTGKKKTTYRTEEHPTTTFLIYYANGSQTIKTVSNHSDMYKFYLSKLDMSG